ncbi:SCO3242 family prenyltransferase [Streptosporangium sp. NPDC001681]|uniref:SCO3242 family prenyltransferase n=1 Tax=Streptosporangium sp. NPDC001681 TaxID=3154395 RepID=UPI00332EFB22
MRALLELVRAPAALSVPGDTMAGAAAAGRPATPGPAVASLFLYLSGMALNDWADRKIDAVERPERPIPSGRITPGRALGIAVTLTGAGLLTAALADGRRGLARAGLLAGAVWAYDLGLKRTAAGPAAMAACRALDVLLGTGERAGTGGLMALAIGAHTYGISLLGRAEVKGAHRGTINGALAASAAAAGLAALSCLGGGRHPTPPNGPCPGNATFPVPASHRADAPAPLDRAAAVALLVGYAAVTAGAQAGLRASPDPDQVRHAVRLGILGLIPLQAAGVAGRGRLAQACALLAAMPAGQWLSARMATS